MTLCREATKAWRATSNNTRDRGEGHPKEETMARKLMLALALLVVAVVPAQAMDREVRDWRGHAEHERFHRFERHPYYAYGVNPYGYIYNPYGDVYTPQYYW